MNFAEACAEAAVMPEFVKQYNRLTGNNLHFSKPRSPIESMVDSATGYKGFDEEEMRKFADFFYEFVWSRLPDEYFANNMKEETPCQSK